MNISSHLSNKTFPFRLSLAFNCCFIVFNTQQTVNSKMHKKKFEIYCATSFWIKLKFQPKISFILKEIVVVLELIHELHLLRTRLPRQKQEILFSGNLKKKKKIFHFTAFQKPSSISERASRVHTHKTSILIQSINFITKHKLCFTKNKL